MFEIVNGTTTFRDLLYGEEFCGGIRDGRELKAFVPGGGSAPWFVADQLDLPFEAKPVGADGSMLGSGAIMVMDETTDIPVAALTLCRFYANESCGKCVPCREGGTWLARIMQRIFDGDGTEDDLDQLLQVGESICPGAFPHAVERAPRDLDAVAVPVPDDDDLLRRAVGVRAGALRPDAVPRGVRGTRPAVTVASAHPRRGHRAPARRRRGWRVTRSRRARAERSSVVGADADERRP